MQERCNSIANALKLRLSCTNPSICLYDCLQWLSHWHVQVNYHTWTSLLLWGVDRYLYSYKICIMLDIFRFQQNWLVYEQYRWVNARKTLTPLLMHCSYVFLAQTHRYEDFFIYITFFMCWRPAKILFVLCLIFHEFEQYQDATKLLLSARITILLWKTELSTSHSRSLLGFYYWIIH